jgi:hypothetical protein
MRPSIQLVLVSAIALTVGMLAGLGVAEYTWRNRVTDVEARLAAAEANARKSVTELAEQERLARATAAKEEADRYTQIADRDARIEALKLQLRTATARAQELASANRRQEEQIKALQEAASAVAKDETISFDPAPGVARADSSEKLLRMIGTSFRGEHPVSGGPFTVTQVRIEEDAGEYADLIFELRNDSGGRQERAFFDVDILGHDGMILERVLKLSD